MVKFVQIPIICFLFLTTSCSYQSEKEGGSLFRYNEAANITSLDPAFARDQAIIWATNQIFNGLVQLGDQLQIQPCIASSWTISPDGLLYTFYLRSDVFFHDSPVFKDKKGRRVVARDFIYSFNRILDPAVASPGAWIFNYVNKSDHGFDFDAPNDTTLTIRLKQTFPPFLGLLSMQYCSVVPAEAIAYYGNDFRRNPVGSGPFLMKMWKEGVKLVLLKNPRYFETENGNPLPYLDAVSISFIADKQSAFLEFMKGKLDFMSGIDPTYKDEVLTIDGKLKSKYSSRINLITQPYLNTEYLGFMIDARNTGSRINPVMDRRVRKAINMAFDRKKMVQYLRNGIGTPGIYGITPKGLPSFDSTCIYYDHQPETARSLLAQAGYPGGKGLPQITLTSTPDYLDICKYLQHQVAELGIDLQIEVSPPAAVKEMKAQAKLPFFRASWIADYPDAENYLSMFSSRNFCPAGPNYTHFSDPEFDRLYDKSMVTVDDSVRIRYYRQMEKIVMDEAPVVVLYYDQVLRFVQKDIKGIGINPMNLLTLKRVRK